MAATDYPEINIDDLMQRIRAEAERHKAVLDKANVSFGSPASSGRLAAGKSIEIALAPLAAPTVSLKSKSVYQLTDFIDFDDEDFIRLVYQRLLKREPDRNGLEYYVSQLRTGSLSKIEILGRLRYSAEGRVRRVKIKGLLAPFVSKSIGRTPVIGYVWRLLNAVLRLPASVRDAERLEAHTGFQNQQLRRQIDDFIGRLETMLRAIAQGKADTAALIELGQTLEATIQREINDAAQSYSARILDLKRHSLDQQRRLSFLLEEVRQRMPEPLTSAQLQTLSAEEDHMLDSFYVTFEDSFRGARDDIKQQVAGYLPLIEQAGAATANAPILDLGCGRGEWLELLKENGFTARGLDSNRTMVQQCHDLGLDVIEAEALGYLRQLQPDSLGAVTGMHIIEHIPFKSLIQLFDETLRVLKPGGVILFETPNPENINVGACNFYLDPTHQRPLPPEMIKFVVEARGFIRVDIMRLHPYPKTDQLQTSDPKVQEVINNFLFGPQDYAVVAYKA